MMTFTYLASVPSHPSWSTRPPGTCAGRPCPPNRRPWDSPHLQFEALLTAAREPANPCDFALVTLLGLRIFEATSADIADLGEEHGHRVLRVCGEGTKVLVPLPPAVGRAIDRAVAARGPQADPAEHPRRPILPR